LAPASVLLPGHRPRRRRPSCSPLAGYAPASVLLPGLGAGIGPAARSPALAPAFAPLPGHPAIIQVYFGLLL